MKVWYAKAQLRGIGVFESPFEGLKALVKLAPVRLRRNMRGVLYIWVRPAYVLNSQLPSEAKLCLPSWVDAGLTEKPKNSKPPNCSKHPLMFQPSLSVGACFKKKNWAFK